MSGNQKSHKTGLPSSIIRPEFTKFHSKCVCEICSCGKHNCPKHPRKAPFIMDTTFKASYKNWDIKPQQPCAFDRPHQNHKYDPELLRSNYQNDYINYPLPPSEIRSQGKSVEPNQPFYADSEYRHNFIRHPSHQRKKRVQEIYVPLPSTFYDNSTYKGDYKTHPYQGSQPFKLSIKGGPDIASQTGNQRNSSYKNDYKPHDIKNPQKINQKTQSNIYGDPGQAEKQSIYRKDYQKFNRQLYEKSTCPINVMPSRPQLNIQYLILQSIISRQVASKLQQYQQQVDMKGIFKHINKKVTYLKFQYYYLTLCFFINQFIFHHYLAYNKFCQ